MSIADTPALHLAFASLHVLLGHFGSAAIHRWRFGRNPLVLRSAPDSTHRKTSLSLASLSVAWAATLTSAAYWPAFRNSAKGAPMVRLPDAVPWAIAVAGLALMVAAQASMGDAFRVGQDPRHAPAALCESGLHRISRNPIYVGSWLCLAGMTLWWPCRFLVLCCGAIGVGIHVLVREEEAFLRARFGERYEAYARRVPRYLGIPS